MPRAPPSLHPSRPRGVLLSLCASASGTVAPSESPLAHWQALDSDYIMEQRRKWILVYGAAGLGLGGKGCTRSHASVRSYTGPGLTVIGHAFRVRVRVAGIMTYYYTVGSRARNPRWEPGMGMIPDPRQIGDGGGDGPPIPGKLESGIGDGDGPGPRL